MARSTRLFAFLLSWHFKEGLCQGQGNSGFEQASQKARFEEEKSGLWGLFLGRLGGSPKRSSRGPEAQLKTSPEHDTVCIFATFECKNGPEHATVGIFAVFRCENGPEHDAVGILATFKAKTGPTHGPLGKF